MICSSVFDVFAAAAAVAAAAGLSAVAAVWFMSKIVMGIFWLHFSKVEI